MKSEELEQVYNSSDCDEEVVDFSDHSEGESENIDANDYNSESEQSLDEDVQNIEHVPRQETDYIRGFLHGQRRTNNLEAYSSSNFE